MIKKTIFLILTGLSFHCLSQPANHIPLKGSAKTDIEKKITMASQKIASLQCRFIQTKTSTLFSEEALSKGLLYYKTPNSLRWEYTEPTTSILIFHKENTYLKDENGVVSNPNKMFKQLGNFIVSTINGKGLIANDNFKIDYLENGKDKSSMWIMLTPVSKRLKDMYSSILIKISTVDYLALEIILEETSGDKTTIILSDKKINANMPESRFSIH
ncbi:MAG: outer membrane lipoprotein carrier protein LolA [Bacteroidales bacterium]|nr:outer membrane lipoprotein carrier protein LolA [Bacteroidales bacterium]